MKDRQLKCVTCGDAILQERVELGFKYCTKPKCVRVNREAPTVLEIAQHKSNPEYVILDGPRGQRALTDMREGKYRRDPVVVKREARKTVFDVPRGTFRKPNTEKIDPNRVKFVQALREQGYKVDEILEKGAYMNLTRSEVLRYLSGRRRAV